MTSFKDVWSFLKLWFPPAPTFKTDQIPDLSGKVVIVTGSNVGIGYETVKVLLQHNAKVYLAARSTSKAEEAIRTLKAATGKEAIFLQLDLSDLPSVKKSAEAFLSKEQELHILFNNAGVGQPPMNMLTEQGYDLTFGTNVIGPHLFTELLMPALLAGVKSSSDGHARVITTSSNVAYVGNIHWDTFKDGPARMKLSSGLHYAQSKLANVIVARQISKRYADKGIISISAHPGVIKTEISRHAPRLVRAILSPLQWSAFDGALTQLYAGTMPEALNYNGEFLVAFCRLARCKDVAYDDAIGERLWQWLQTEVEPYRH